MKGVLKDPVFALELRLIRFWHSHFVVRRHFNFLALLNVVVDGFQIFRKDEGVTNVFGDPVFLGLLQIIEDQLAVLLQFFGEFLLALFGHFATAAALAQPARLSILMLEELTVRRVLLLETRLETAELPDHPSTRFLPI